MMDFSDHTCYSLVTIPVTYRNNWSNSENTSTLASQRPSITSWSAVLCLLFDVSSWNMVLLFICCCRLCGRLNLSRMRLTGHFLFYLLDTCHHVAF